MSASLRLFAALELPPPALKRLAEIGATLQHDAPRGAVRWVRPTGIHLTLKFYGNVEPPRRAALRAMLAEAAQASRPLALSLGGLGCFPNAGRPRVIWVGVEGEVEALHALQRAVEAGSRALGFPPEGRAFSPHLTLGRVSEAARPEAVRRLAEALSRARLEAGAPFRLEALSLMQSDLKPDGAVYTQLFAAALGG